MRERDPTDPGMVGFNIGAVGTESRMPTALTTFPVTV